MPAKDVLSAAKKKLATEKSNAATIKKTATKATSSRTMSADDYYAKSRGGKVRPPRASGVDLNIRDADTDTKGNKVVRGEEEYRQKAAMYGPNERKTIEARIKKSVKK